MSNKAYAFVLMPFHSDFDDVYKMAIKSAAEELNVKAERVDEQLYDESMLEQIYRQIDICDFITADMSRQNPNVFYEVGYAHAKRKKVILITENKDDIPFDLKHHSHIIYDKKIHILKEELIKRINWVKGEIEKDKKNPISIEIDKPWAFLDKYENHIDAVFHLSFIIRNGTDIKSPDIDSLYIHTGRGWSFKSDKDECTSSESDRENFTNRHFIKLPIPRLSPGAWHKVKLIGEKNVWNSIHNKEDAKDEYKLSGRILIEVFTGEGTFSQHYDLDLTAEEIPF